MPSNPNPLVRERRLPFIRGRAIGGEDGVEGECAVATMEGRDLPLLVVGLGSLPLLVVRQSGVSSLTKLQLEIP